MAARFRKTQPMPSQEQLRELLDYEPATGLLIWRQRPESSATLKEWNRRWAGKPALNARHSAGYRHGCIQARYLFSHRVIWKWLYGDEPSEIDHINGVRTDNRACNLVASDCTENKHNMARTRRNTSGVSGVTWSQSNQKWNASIVYHNRTRWIGGYELFEDAVAARKAKEKELGFSERHGEPRRY